MKKILIFLCLIFSTGVLSAKSDIQITAPIFSFFNKFEVSCNNLNEDYYVFSQMGDSIIRLSNQNYFGNSRIVFFESMSMVVTQIAPLNKTDAGIGLQISFGPSFWVKDGTVVSIGCSFGPHIKFFDNGIVGGSELDLQAKFTPHNRCSPVVGMISNLDFYSSQKMIETVQKERIKKFTNSNYTYIESYEEHIEHDIDKYFHFYVQPYIAFCINLF